VPAADGNCSQTAVVAPENAEVWGSSRERSKAGDGALVGERVLRVGEHERSRAFGSIESVDERTVPPRYPSAIDSD